MKSNLNYNYTFSINLAPSGITFGVKSIGKCLFTIQIWLDLIKIQNQIFCVYIYKHILDFYCYYFRGRLIINIPNDHKKTFSKYFEVRLRL